MADISRLTENIKAGTGLVQEKLEKIPILKKAGELLRIQFQESRRAQEELMSFQREQSIPFLEALRGKKLTEEEKLRIPVIDPTGFIGKIGDISKLSTKAAQRLMRPPKNPVQTIGNFVKAVETRIGQFGGAGKELIQKVTKATDVGEIQAGKRIARLQEVNLPKLSREEKFNLLDTLEGRAVPISEKVTKASQTSRGILNELAREAEDIGVLVKEKRTLEPTKKIPTGLTPFQRGRLEEGKKVFATIEKPFFPRKDFFPHTFPSIETLKKGQVREDVIENVIRLGVKNNVNEANKFLDDYVSFIETGQRKQSLIDHLVKTGQAKNEPEALRNLQQFRKRTIKKQGSLEFARQIDLPFYDPDPSRVLPTSIVSQSKRLAQISTFGQKNQIINSLINRIRKESGDIDADFTRQAVDRILGIINNQQSMEAKVSTLLRTIQGFKLGLASIPNMTQGVLNTLLAGDFKAVYAGLKGVLSKQGQQLALKSGATLESTINESLREVGASGKALGTFLKATGFSSTERFNRVISANAGADLLRRSFNILKKNPTDKLARGFIEDMGINIESLLTKNRVDEDDILKAAQKFTNITQFRARPQDLPFFASTPTGKIFFQFKNFIYGQSRLLYRTTIRELKNRNFGRAARNLLILATVFPLTGEVVADIRSIITGRKRESVGLERYFDNITQVGAVGIFGEALRSGGFGRGVEFLAGPTVAEAGEFIELAAKPERIPRFVVGRIPLAGQVLKPRLFPTKKEGSKQTTNPFSF